MMDLSRPRYVGPGRLTTENTEGTEILCVAIALESTTLDIPTQL